MFVFEERLSFWMFYSMKNDHEIIEKCRWGGHRWRKLRSRSMVEPWLKFSGANPLRNFGFWTSGGQINSWKCKKPSELIYFECKFDVNMFLYALKQDFMKIEFENSVRRLSFLCRLPDIKIAWINPCHTLQMKSSASP